MKRLLCLIAPLIAVFAGCAGEAPESAWPEPRPLGSDLPAIAPPEEPQDSRDPAEYLEPEGEITLRIALASALVRNPRLASTSLEVRIREARTLQAGQFPNPELELEVEGFGGTREHRKFNTAEYSLTLSQIIELGDKRMSRRKAAELDERLAGWDYETLRIAVMVETTLAFVDVLVAQDQVRIAEESALLAQQVLDAVAERVKAGKDSPLVEVKAGIERSNAKIDLAASRRTLASARIRLAATWGSAAPKFSSVTGNAALLPTLPAFEAVAARIDRNPEIARWSTEIELRLAQLAVEKSRRVPDLTLSLGGRYYAETRDGAFLAGLSVGLPLFDRNQGAVREAEFQRMKATLDRRAEETRVRSALAEAHEALLAAHGESTILDGEILPAAQRAFDAARTGYQEGEFGFLEFLDAQRTLFEAKQRRTEALSTYLKAIAVEESLIGTGLEQVMREEEARKKEGK